MAIERLSTSAAKVQEALGKVGLESDVVELPGSTRTAADAARSIGCTTAQIAKSLVFQSKDGEEAVLAIVSGTNRVDLTKLSAAANQPLLMADAKFVKATVGYAIGGVPPIAADKVAATYLDQDLCAYDVIWAAAGTPHAVFQLSPADLVTLTGGHWISLAQ